MAFGASKPDNPVRPVTPVKPVHTPAAPKPVTPDAPKAEASDPWAAVLDAPIAPTFVRGSRVDVEKDIPASIRKALEISLQNYGEEMKVVRDGKAQTLKARTPKYRDFNCGTVENAKKFVVLARKYAKYRTPQQVSVRAFPLKDKAGKDTAVVHYAAMPLQTRDTARLPGTTAK